MPTIALDHTFYTFDGASDAERFFAKVEPDLNSGCWLWSASVDRHGYGHFGIRGKNLKAYRVAYANLVGRVPVELVLDHRCRTAACCNPAHLRVVTRRVNALENNPSPIAENAAKTHCPQGHPLSGDNLYVWPTNGGRSCLACRNENNARHNQAKKAARRAAGGRGGYRDRTHCPKGHPFSGDNLYIRPDTGARGCKECRREVVRAAYLRKAAEHRD